MLMGTDHEEGKKLDDVMELREPSSNEMWRSQRTVWPGESVSVM